MENPSKETEEKWINDPNNWIWGVFYFNPEDRRITPPKRIPGIGVTINFANPKSILFLIGSLLFFAFVVFSIIKKDL